LNSSFFLNNYFERYLVFFERISFEFSNFKFVLFDVFQEKAGLSDEECNINDSRHYDQDVMTCFKNLFDLALRLSKVIERSVFQNSDWAILFSKHYLVFSLLQNITGQQFSQFQDIYGKANYGSPDSKKVIASGFNCFLSTLVNYLMGVLKKMNMDKLILRKRLTKEKKLKLKTIIPQVRTIVEFMASCISGDNENDKIVSKSLINLLLNFLMVRLKTVSDEILALKYTTSKLIIAIL
jgi:hypothetical protein